MNYIEPHIYTVAEQCGMVVWGTIYVKNDRDQYTDVKITLPMFQKCKLRYTAHRHGYILITDLVSEKQPTRTMDFVKALIEYKETVLAVTPVRNVNYNNHIIQAFIWLPAGEYYSNKSIENLRTIHCEHAILTSPHFAVPSRLYNPCGTSSIKKTGNKKSPEEEWKL